MKYVDKIIFRDKETYNKLYQGSDLLFEVQIEEDWKGLTFTALEPSTIQYIPSSVSTAQYSYDAVNWETADKVTINLNTGDKVYFKGTIISNHSLGNYAYFTMTGKVEASGSIMSMQNGNPKDKTLKYNEEFFNLFQGCTSLVTAPELPATKLTSYCYWYMFHNCTSLVKAPELPVTTLADNCYTGMFYGCTSLTQAPELPATTLAEYCYQWMFSGCTSLINAPALPAKTLAKHCYDNMFENCTSLTTAPELPATTLADNCYFLMFEKCTSLVNAPELPATTLAPSCYDNMFLACKSLVTAPELPATTLVDSCYSGMFIACTSLVNAPALPATTLAKHCYSNMFDSCTNLTTAPALPATTLADMCYLGMFIDCTSLVTAPELPATTLTNNCYAAMFRGCTSLVNAPELPATTLADFCYSAIFNGCTSLVKAPELPAITIAPYCYDNMFLACSKLNYIKCYAKEYNSNWFADWVKDVQNTGDFYCYNESIFKKGTSGIPTGWTVHSEIVHKEYDALYVSGRYNFKIPKGDGTYYVIDTKNDCEVDIISDNNKSSLTGKIFTSNSQGDYYEWDLFFTGYNLYFDLSMKNNRRLYWRFGTLNANTKYTIGGSNGNYLGTDRALYVNGSKKASSTTKSTYNNTSDIAFIGENVTDFYVGNIKIYEKTGLVYHIVPIMYNGNVAFYDKVNKRFMEITRTPPSEYAKTRATGEKVII